MSTATVCSSHAARLTRTVAANRIQEQLACGCASPTMMLGPGTGCGRRMGDVTSVFVIQLYELYEGTADRALLSELFPAAARGARWAMRNADNGTGLPQGLQCTYDQYGFQVRPSLKNGNRRRP